MPANNITRQQMAQVLVNGFGLKDLAGVESEVTDNDKAQAQYVNYINILSENKVTEVAEFNPTGYVKRGQMASFLNRAFDAAHPVATTPEVVSVSANTAKSLEVKFAAPVDTTKATVQVKKGNSTYEVTPTWSADKKSVVLESAGKFAEGTYTVTVSGLTEVPLTNTVEVKAEALKEIKILSDNAVLKAAGSDTVTVGYQLLNQYGEDVTKDARLGNSDNFVKSSAGTVTMSQGVIEIDTNNQLLKAGDKLPLTLVDKTTTISATKTLTVVTEAKVAQADITSVYNEDKKALTVDNANEDFYLLLNAVDQYGNNVKGDIKSDITVVSSNPSVADVVRGQNNEEVISTNLTDDKLIGLELEVRSAGEVVFTVISNSTGKSTQYKVTVEAGTKVDTVEFGTPELTVAGSETTLIPATVLDNKGNQIKDARSSLLTNLTPTVQNATGGKWVTKNGNLYYSVDTATVANQTTKSLVLTLTTPTNKVTTKIITINPDAVPVEVANLVSTQSTSILATKSETITLDEVVFFDQYGREYDASEANAFDGYTLRMTSSDTSVLVVDGNDLKAQNKKGSSTVTFDLVRDSDSKVLSSFTKKFNVVVQSEFTSYEITALPTLLNTADTDYRKEIKVYGVTANNQKVKLDNTFFNVIDGALEATVDEGTGKVYASAENVTFSSETDTAESKDVTLTVVINATGAELSTTVKVSEEAPKVASISFTDDGTALGNPITAADLEITNNFDLADLNEYTVIKDQYGANVVDTGASIAFAIGGDPVANALRLTVSNFSEVGTPNIVPVNNGSSSAYISADQLAVNEKFDAKVTSGSINSTLKVTVDGLNTAQ